MPVRLITLGFMLVFIGVLVIMAGMLSMVYQSWKVEGEGGPSEGGVRGGGIVMIGPIPLIFGTDVGALKIVMILAFVLMVIAALFIILPLWMGRI